MNTRQVLWGLLMLFTGGWAAASIPSSERAALIALYESTGGANWTNHRNWLGPAGTECNWYGITCDHSGKHVATISLPGNTLVGSLPRELGNLTYLRELVLSRNQLKGAIPTELGSLTSLQWIELDSNRLTGGIPNLGRLSQLHNLDLANNLLTGPVPASLGQLGGLQNLYLSQNDFSGPIPPELGNLSELLNLYLDRNSLSGTIPAQIGSLGKLQQLDLDFNFLGGSIPPQLGNLAALQRLQAFYNRLSGNIPPILGQLANLQYLDLSWNQLSGEIPKELGNLANLRELWLYNNQLGGAIPAELSQLGHLQVLYLENNLLAGSIPAALGQLIELRYLLLGWNRLSGSIPTELGALTKLYQLDLQSNRLGGLIPAWLADIPNLQALALSSNQFSGPIPEALSGRASLQYLWLDRNLLAGPIPGSLVQLVNLAPAGEWWDSGLRLDHNALWSADPYLTAFIDSRHYGDTWDQDQLTTPADFQIQSSSPSTFTLKWTPPAQPDYSGGYEIWQILPEKAFQLWRTLRDPGLSRCRSCLCPYGYYAFQLRAFRNPDASNDNRVTTSSGPIVEVFTPPASGFVQVYTDQARVGAVDPASPSQVLPASQLTILFNYNSFPEASASNPVILWIHLPDGAVLSQTLATGNDTTASPLPTAGELVQDLAVQEYTIPQKDGRPEPVSFSALAQEVGPHAVQLFRYVAGEEAILLRLTESTAGWYNPQKATLLGVTIGIGGGFWPKTPYSNWGPAGIGRQASTLLHADLRRFEFDPEWPVFPIPICPFYQHSGLGTPAAVSPCEFSLFRRDSQSLEVPDSPGSSVNTRLADYITADLDGDGQADLIFVDGERPLIRWAPGLADSTFGESDWRSTVSVPVTITVKDVNGDGLPDLLAGTQAGHLEIYLWDQIFNETADLDKRLPAAAVRSKLTGIPTDSLTADFDQDSHPDYASVSAAGGSLDILFGDAFATPGLSLATGASPLAVVNGDFQGDGWPDLAVANGGAGTLSVYLNQGNRSFAANTVSGLGNGLVDLAAAPFNADGRDDLAAALSTDKKLLILPASSAGAFSLASAQAISFQRSPSAIQADNFDGQFQADVLVGFADWYKMGVCTSDATGTLTYAYNLNTLGDVVTDPALGTIMTEDNILTVAAGTSYGGVSSQDGAAAVGQHGCDAIHFPRSKDLSFSLVNLGESAALVNLELYDTVSKTLAGGVTQYDGQPVKSKVLSGGLAPGRQYARYLTDAEVLGSDAADFDSWVRGFLADTDVYGLWLVNNGTDLTYLDGARLANARDTMSDFILPVTRVGDGESTTGYLMNPNQAAANLTLSRIDQEGVTQESVRLVLGGRGRAALPLGTAFPGALAGDFVRIQADQPVLGVELFGDAQTVACLEGMKAGAEGGVMYSPHLAVGDFGVAYGSLLTLVNTGATSASVALTLLDDLGQTEHSGAVTLPAGGKRELDLGAFFGLTTPTSGYLKVDPGAATGVTGCLTFGETAGGRFSSSLPLQQTGHNRFLLGHIASGTMGTLTFFTGMALLDPAADPLSVSDVTITAYDQDGRLLATRKLLLGGYDGAGDPRPKRQVFLLDQFIPELGPIFGGYLTVENQSAADGLLVFELFGDTGLTFLSAVPAVPLD